MTGWQPIDSAPWFLQQRAAIWIQERTESQKTLWERIRRQMGLE